MHIDSSGAHLFTVHRIENKRVNLFTIIRYLSSCGASRLCVETLESGSRIIRLFFVSFSSMFVKALATQCLINVRVAFFKTKKKSMILVLCELLEIPMWVLLEETPHTANGDS